jgi:alkylated DNA repair dioxygenase AlkB
MPAGQLDLFAPAPALPPGLRHWDEAVPREEERALLEACAALDFAAFSFHGHVGRRRVVSFGWAYDFEREALRDAPPIPPFLLALRERIAALAGLAPETLGQALVTEYPPGAAIGWHRDKAVFGDVLGVSLGAPCLFRLRRKAGASWQRASLRLEPRSAYLLRGPARTEWEHSIPPIAEGLRHSVTFRTLRAA